MEGKLLARAAEFIREARRKRRWTKAVTALAAVVVFGTTYALILPAITMQAECGLTEHTHTDACYTVETVTPQPTMLCSAETLELHEHDEDCYNDDDELICGYADFVVHEHDESCYDLNGDLICTLPEIEEHEHDEDCYETEEVLVCEEEEVEAHQHGDDCYDENGDLTCDLEETEGHRHGEDCYETERVLTCDEPEVELHEHDEDCYEENPDDPEDPILICEKIVVLAYQHDESCIQQPEGDPYEVTTLTCGMKEHQHEDSCYLTVPPAEDAPEADTPDQGEEPADEEETPEEALPLQVQTVIDLIEAIPAAEEIGETLAAYEDADDTEGYEAYFAELSTQAQAAHTAYEDLTAGEQEQVTNAGKLLDLAWLWEAETLTENFQFDKPTVVKSASTRDFIDLNLYDYNGYINNEKYDKDKKYPGFQWNGGAYMFKNEYNRHMVDYIDFGNSNITDRSYGGSSTSITNGLSKNKVTVGVLYNNGSQDSTGEINWLWWDNTNASITNRPVGMSTMTNTALSRTLKDGYPALSDGTSLSYLFKDDNYSVFKQNTESIDGLFQKDEKTGAYYYNSRWNHAQYSNNEFTLYDQIITPNFIVYPFGNFLPFNTITDSTKATQVGSINGNSGTTVNDYVQKLINDMSGSLSGSPTKTQLTAMLEKYKASNTDNNITTAKAAISDYLTGSGATNSDSLITDTLLNKMYNIDWDEETNFFFGMDMSMTFMQPKGGLTGNDGKQEMKFYFTGDDDVWVYIDDVLFLDLTGIHRHVGGEIDFVNGKVHYYALDTSGTGDVSNTPYATYTFAQLLTAAGKSTDALNDKGTFKDYTTHSFKFYYMERGSGSSVCRMNFNFPLLRKNSISVTKELSVDDESKLPLLGDPDFKFQVLKAGGNELFIGANTPYDILDSTGTKIGAGTTDANGVFTLKANQTAVFSNIDENKGKYFVRELLDTSVFEQYGTVTVDGTTQTKNNDVTVGSDTFTGVDSTVKDVSDGSTIFHFNNKVTTSKLGSLTIEKKLETYPKDRAATEFQFEVTLDGKPLPVGTKYTVGEETRTVEKAGIIILAPDETATLSNILAGTRFTVKETENAAYTATYQVDQNDPTSDPATGVIGVNSSVAVLVTNQEKGASVEIPVTKTISYGNGTEHTYRFQLVQVTSSDGETMTESGLSKTLEIKISGDGPVREKFAIDYVQADLEEVILPATYYYKITEVDGEESGTVYDQSAYVAEVTVSGDDNGTLSAKVTNIWKDGTELTTDENESVGEVTFHNRLAQYELPQTGGPGTIWFLLGGSGLMALALWRVQKKREHERRSNET